MKKYVVILFIIVFSISCKKETTKTVLDAKVETKQVKQSALINAFKYKPNAEPIISVHRGGKAIKGYPENCLETLAYVNDSIKAIYEIDVAKTKDNVLVLMHDNTINRTTTGKGKVVENTYNELKAFNLVDDFGVITEFKIPLFKEVLFWAKQNNVVLTVDIKRGVDVGAVVDLIREVKAEDVSIIITYDLKQAEAAYAVAPELLLSVSARNTKELDWLLHSKIPTQNMLAFTGTRLSDTTLYNAIHAKGIKTILGTLGNLDKQAEIKGDALYKTWVEKGIDVLATDRPFAAANAVN
ncbi:glycerophosphodiester phosphodiesterase family protein [Pontimicrobium sp. MEBiC06410]